jgi:hypothetical protein
MAHLDLNDEDDIAVLERLNESAVKSISMRTAMRLLDDNGFLEPMRAQLFGGSGGVNRAFSVLNSAVKLFF